MKLLLLSVIFGLQSFAAPIPMTSSSKAISPLWGLYRSELGFQVDGRNSGWQIAEGPQEKENVLALFKSPMEGREKPALFTIRVDKNPNRQKMKEYVRSWLVFYERLGVQVLGHQTFSNNGETGYVLDLMNGGLKSQSRQALYFRGKDVVVLTCSDAPQFFNKALNTCNQLIRSFSWETASPSEISIQK